MDRSSLFEFSLWQFLPGILLGAIVHHLVVALWRRKMHQSKPQKAVQQPLPAQVSRRRTTRRTDEHSLPTIQLAKDSDKEEQSTVADKAIQHDDNESTPLWLASDSTSSTRRTDAELITAFRSSEKSSFSVEELLRLIELRLIKAWQLDKYCGSEARAVHVRRRWLAAQTACKADLETLQRLPYLTYDYSLVSNASCENVVGYIPLPCGVAGPLTVNNRACFVPMATTEGALIASTSRGCRAISLSKQGGITAFVERDVMTRAPLVEFDSVELAHDCKQWLTRRDTFALLKQHFDATTRYGRLESIDTVTQVGTMLYIRFAATTGDAMGMNMLSKGCEAVLERVREVYPCMRVRSLSSNLCTDKKSTGINWFSGRGKSVHASATIDSNVVRDTLKSSVDALVQLNIDKNLVGSALAGGAGGSQNAHAANIIAAVFAATGQDLAQVVESSLCQTYMKKDDNGDLFISVRMPCIEVGTYGGGTMLPAQSSALEILGCRGGHPSEPGAYARRLAEVFASVVLAGELNLMAALTSGDLVKAHMTHNRSSVNLRAAASSASLSRPTHRSQSPLSYVDTRSCGQTML